MKYNHNFKCVDSADSYRQYKADNLNARLDFLAGNILRLAIYKDGADILSTFCINPDNAEIPNTGRNKLDTKGFPGYKAEVTEADGTEEITLGDMKIKVNLNNLLINYYKGEARLFGDRGPLAYNLEGEFGTGSIHYLSRQEGERVYGLGDKGGDLNKAGRRFMIETTDCMGYNAKTADPLYKHIPFYICENSVGSYGVFYDTSCNCVIDFGQEHNNYYETYKYFKGEDETLVVYFFFGSKKEILTTFCKTVGKQAFPPKWSMDYCASTMAYTDAPDAEIQMNGFLKKIKVLDLNCQGFYLSSGYTQIGNQRCVFHWNKEKFPDPKAFISNFNNAGVNLIPNIKPAFLTTHPLYDEIAQKGMFVKNPDGTPFVTQFWDGYGSYLDFTNQQTFDFWSEKVTSTLLDYGIHATWNDNNEYDIKDVEATANGFNGKRVQASWIKPDLTYLMVKSSYDAQRKKYPELRPFLSTRSGHAGARRMAQTWSGDNRTAFEDIRYCHNIGLTMSMSGLYLYGNDLGGFAGPQPTPELLLRWLQHGVFEPRFTIHSWNSDGSATMPWLHPEVLTEVKELFAQRKSFIPYLYNAVYNSVEKDVPVTSPVFMNFEDKNIPVENDALMYGSDILVGFVFDEGRETAKLYLPADCDWFIDEQRLAGGHTVEYMMPATAKVPYFVKEGSVLPLDIGESGYNKESKVQFTVYPLVEGEFESTYFDDDGVSYDYLNNDCVKLRFVVECNKDTVTVVVNNEGNKKYKPEIRLVKSDKRELRIIEK